MVLDLTAYEVGNAVWKEHRGGRIRDPGAAAKLFQEIFNALTMQRATPSMQKILELAVGEGLTFYDASYLYTARSLKLKLVTEDHDLQKYPESISVKQLLKELGV